MDDHHSCLWRWRAASSFSTQPIWGLSYNIHPLQQPSQWHIRMLLCYRFGLHQLLMWCINRGCHSSPDIDEPSLPKTSQKMMSESVDCIQRCPLLGMHAQNNFIFVITYWSYLPTCMLLLILHVHPSGWLVFKNLPGPKSSFVRTILVMS